MTVQNDNWLGLRDKVCVVSGAGGGIGVALKEELILMHCVIDMGLGVDAAALRGDRLGV